MWGTNTKPIFHQSWTALVIHTQTFTPLFYQLWMFPCHVKYIRCKFAEHGQLHTGLINPVQKIILLVSQCSKGYRCTVMFREELVNIALNDTCFTSAEFTNDQNFEQVLMSISSSTTSGLQNAHHGIFYTITQPSHPAISNPMVHHPNWKSCWIILLQSQRNYISNSSSTLVSTTLIPGALLCPHP